jgi:hypothetical protein
MPMGRRSAAGRNVHIDDAVAAIGLLAGDGKGVGIAHQSDVGQAIRLREREMALGIVGR